MSRTLLRYFEKRPAVSNVCMFATILLAVFLWDRVPKEEMPDFAMEFVRIQLTYEGAAAEDVEVFVTRPIEENLKSLSGIESDESVSGYANASISVSFESGGKSLSDKILDVKDAVSATRLPEGVEEPVYRQFRSDEKAIIDIGLFLKDKDLLSTPDRQQLQAYALGLRDRLISRLELSGVDFRGYLKPEIQIKVDPKKLDRYELSLAQLGQEIRQKDIRRFPEN